MAHSGKITNKPKNGDRKPKNTGDQRKLRPNWIKNNLPAVLTDFFCQPSCQIK